MNPFSQWLAQRIQEKLPGYEAQSRMSKHLYRPTPAEAPSDARDSGVLITLFEKNDQTHLILIMRTADGGAHSGQIAFPGGKKELSDEDIIQTALREANEEINISLKNIKILGKLSPLYIPVSNFIMNPVIAFYDGPLSFKKSEREVAEILQFSLKDLFDAKGDTTIQLHQPIKGKMDIKGYLLNESIIVWGATAMILSELEVLWDEFNRDVKI